MILVGWTESYPKPFNFLARRRFAVVHSLVTKQKLNPLSNSLCHLDIIIMISTSRM